MKEMGLEGRRFAPRLRLLAGLALVLGWVWSTPATASEPTSRLGVKVATTADHGKFKELQGEFASGPEVTKACLACHTEAADQVHRTKHWTWEFLNPDTEQTLGKKNVLNNFCISVPSNYAFCTTCHVGYGWKDAKFDFSSQENVDCLVCHDTTGDYRKPPGLAGNPPAKDMEFPPGSGQDRQGGRPRAGGAARSARPAATPAAPATSSAAAATASSTATWTARWRRR